MTMIPDPSANPSTAAGVRPKVALIAGPTASGKSALALDLAEAVGGTLINADASQYYADLRILSARPTPADEARVPHHLFGTRDGADPASAADWADDAANAIEEVLAEGRVPIVVGGTGLYIRTLLDGIAPVPDIDPAIRDRVRALSPGEATAALRREDPEASVRLNANDAARIWRALEVVRSTGRTLAEWQTTKTGGIGDRVEIVPMILLPPRDLLYARCDARFEAMLNAGAVQEVEALRTRKLDSELPVMRAIGVRDIADFLDMEITRSEMIAAATAATRRYAKRQYTWFNHQPPAEWPRETGTDHDHLVTKLREKLLTH
ncbi:tRNA (adenosine(37)-N6)-dimethylallyltransferase MiaA [Sphingomonas prati]|uniref:tRNA dimethylallyltransferase n=1 Tax=Sphingomonas prati TaxID=1843237 RepID=A0A7W9BSX0_9SPHN|nr:tRNA (adenosine(37)-N6)-dimethylallyltransferase MiaA [Sphingomonas prati]MBB5729507.1 tRNA dimethylallyltransferase [Sphingomonas prati]GGE76889.1 tRNA dimethylallyltransferase [Sphingomonas prati]